MKKYIVGWIVIVVLLIGGIVIYVPEVDAVSKPLTLNKHFFTRQLNYHNAGSLQTVERKERVFDNLVNLDEMPIKHQVSILSAGDIMAHTIQFEAAKREDGYDFYPQFEYVSKKISSKDFAIANLETVFAGEDRRYSGKNMIFNAPDQLGESIKKAGFDILTTANNHSLDRGFSGLSRTIDVLDEIGLMHTGTAKEPDTPILYFEKNHIKIALLSYSYSTNGWPLPEDHPYAINMMEEEQMIKDVIEAKAEADIVMVAIHWGLEYHLNENHHQRDLANSLFYSGADVILGTHPHVLQPFDHIEMEDYSGETKDKFIIYSQGNFISGQRTYPRAIGMFFNMNIAKIGAGAPFVETVSFMPTYVESDYKNGQRYMRILDVHDARMNQEAYEISDGLYRDLEEYETYFKAHINSYEQYPIYLNEQNEYVIYDNRKD